MTQDLSKVGQDRPYQNPADEAASREGTYKDGAADMPADERFHEKTHPMAPAPDPFQSTR